MTRRLFLQLATVPFGNARARAIVLIFIRTDCPISNRYAPEIQRIQKEFSSKGIEFWLVYPSEGSETIRKHAVEYGYTCGVLPDPHHEWVKLAGVKTTPEAAIFTSLKKLVYRGRIDNRYISFGKARGQPTTHDLEAALKALVEGRPIPPAKGPAIGCAIA